MMTGSLQSAGIEAGAKPASEARIMGLCFRHPLGIAAGVDRTGEQLRSLAKLACGHVEVGTVSDPRRLRIPASLGPVAPIIGVNIGSLRLGYSSEVLDDYLACLAAALPHADYVVLNFSNEAAQRSLKSDAARPIVSGARDQIGEYRSRIGRNIPLLAKLYAGPAGEEMPIPPTAANLLDGFVVVGDSVDRLIELRVAFPLHAIISVGGVMTGKDARERRRAGADLVQVHSAFAEGGAAHVETIMRDMERATADE